MSSAPHVSVIVPVHNVVEYVDECLSSIAAQTQQDIEVILVDDGSTDGSEVICDEWAIRDSRFRVIHQTQGGSSAARNRAIDVASGRYITFVDADDVLSPALVETLLGAAEEVDAEIALGELIPFTDILDLHFTHESTVTSSSATDELQTIICVRPQWGPMAKLFRREIFAGGLRFPEGLLHQDLAIMPRLFQRAETCVRTTATVYGYRQRPGSVTDQVHRGAFSLDLITILRENIEFARATEEPASFERYLVTYVHHARKHVERLQTAGAWTRNASFVSAYQALARDYLRELLAVEAITRPQRAAFVLSAFAPKAHVLALGYARRVRETFRSIGPRRLA